jgi:hypothetical protein
MSSRRERELGEIEDERKSGRKRDRDRTDSKRRRIEVSEAGKRLLMQNLARKIKTGEEMEKTHKIKIEEVKAAEKLKHEIEVKMLERLENEFRLCKEEKSKIILEIEHEKKLRRFAEEELLNYKDAFEIYAKKINDLEKENKDIKRNIVLAVNDRENEIQNCLNFKESMKESYKNKMEEYKNSLEESCKNRMEAYKDVLKESYDERFKILRESLRR